MGSDENHFNVSLIAKDEVTSQCFHKPQPFWREMRTEAESNRRSSAYQPNALPLPSSCVYMYFTITWALHTFLSVDETELYVSHAKVFRNWSMKRQTVKKGININGQTTSEGRLWKKDNYLHRVCSLHPAKNGPDLEKTKENLGLQEMNSTLKKIHHYLLVSSFSN